MDDGSKIRSFSRDKTVRTWDVKTGNLLKTCVGTGVSFYDAWMNKTGTLIASIARNEDAIDVWDVSGENWVLKFSLSSNSEKSGIFASFSNDGKYLCTATGEGKASLWSLETGKMVKSLDGHKDLVLGGVFSNDSKKIITMSYDNTARLWDVNSGKMLLEFIGHNDIISCAGFSNDETKIFTASADNTVKLWDANTGKLLFTCLGHMGVVTDAVFSKNDSCLFTIAYDATAIQWEVKSGKKLNQFEGLTFGSGFIPYSLHIELSPDGTCIARTNNIGTIEIWNISQNRIFHELHGLTSRIHDPVFSPDGKSFAAICDDFTVKVWDYKYAKLLFSLKGHRNFINTHTYIPDGSKIITTARDGSAKVWSAKTGLLLYSIVDMKCKIEGLIISPDNKTMLFQYSGKEAELYEIETGKLLLKCSGKNTEVTNAVFSSDGKKLFVFTTDGYIVFYDITQKKEFDKLDINEYRDLGLNVMVTSLLLTPDDKKLIFVNESGTLSAYNVENQTLLYGINNPMCYLPENPFNPDATKIIEDVFDYEGGIRSQIYSVESGELLYSLQGTTVDPNGGIESPFSSDGKWILTQTKEGIVRVWDAKSAEVKTTINIQNNSDRLAFARFLPDNKSVMTGSFKVNDLGYIYQYNPVEIWDIETGKSLGQIKYEHGFPKDFNDIDSLALFSYNSQLTVFNCITRDKTADFIAFDDDDYIVVTPEKYYKCSKNAAGKLLWKVDDQFYQFDQFDIQYNRPDLVLKKTGNTDTALIKLYKNAYLKRLKKSGFSENVFQTGWSCPELKILNAAELPWTTDSPKLKLNIYANDNNTILDRLNITINEVPIFGSNGFDLLELQSSGMEQVFEVDLSEGYNIIQVSCINDRGVESYKETVEINYVPAEPHLTTLYLIAMSVSEYSDSRFNLIYPVKDGRDMANLLSGGIPGIAEKVSIDTLFNSMATRSNLLELKKTLTYTNINDIVVLYVSGHGMLSDKLNFYFATCDMDFAHPEKFGVSYEELEWLLDGIPARKKLILIDACHSGELDKDELEEVTGSVILADGAKSGLKTYSYKSAMMPEQKGNVPFKSAFELMQETFNDLSKGSGTVVISAAAGKGYAIESPEWNNGVFTYSILTGLKNLDADLNSDQKITVSELKKFVGQEVERLTNGKQRPSSRRESLLYDWRLW